MEERRTGQPRGDERAAAALAVARAAGWGEPADERAPGPAGPGFVRWRAGGWVLLWWGGSIHGWRGGWAIRTEAGDAGRRFRLWTASPAPPSPGEAGARAEGGRGWFALDY
jgi:hypothetical protein